MVSGLSDLISALGSQGLSKKVGSEVVLRSDILVLVRADMFLVDLHSTLITL